MLGPLRIRCTKHTLVNELKQNAANGRVLSTISILTGPARRVSTPIWGGVDASLTTACRDTSLRLHMKTAGQDQRKRLDKANTRTEVEP